jgi:hypothetical protein
VAANARRITSGVVTVFEDSVLAVAAVSAPEVSSKLAAIIVGPFDDLSTHERDVLFDTFRLWVEHNGSMADAAAQLYFHPTPCATACTASRNAPAARYPCHSSSPNSAWASRSIRTAGSSGGLGSEDSR